MGTLHLVRHGQASFGTDNYDRLSPLGHRQCEQLGAYFRSRGQRFAALMSGTLQRHDESLAGILRGMGDAAPAAPALRLPTLNEYDSEALIRAVHGGALVPGDSPEIRRHHFRLLRDALSRWMSGSIHPPGMLSFAEFAAGVSAALAEAGRRQDDEDVLIVSSGGPIATAIARVLGTPPEVVIDLNMRMRNTAISELAITPRRLALQTYNTLPHLDGDEHRAWITYA